MSDYSFVSEYQDVDFKRIMKEAPVGVPFIVTQTKDRKTGKPLAWAIFFNINVVAPSIYAKDLEWIMDNKADGYVVLKGVDFSLPPDPATIHNLTVEYYASVVGSGRIPGDVQVLLGDIRKLTNPKDTVTEVTLG